MHYTLFFIIRKYIIDEQNDWKHWNRPQWTGIKKQVWQNTDKKCCWICGKPFNLYFHHLSYERVGTQDEWKDIVIVCNTHNDLCHYTLFGKVPLTKKALTDRFNYLKRAKWRRIRPSHIINWIIDTYSVSNHRKRRTVSW